MSLTGILAHSSGHGPPTELIALLLIVAALGARWVFVQYRRLREVRKQARSQD